MEKGCIELHDDAKYVTIECAKPQKINCIIKKRSDWKGDKNQVVQTVITPFNGLW